jgi:hypothetical protein
VADITRIPTIAGLLKLEVVIDVLRRRTVDWCMRDTLYASIDFDEMDMAAT